MGSDTQEQYIHGAILIPTRLVLLLSHLTPLPIRPTIDSLEESRSTSLRGDMQGCGTGMQ
jgi:hypothetical protein